MGDRTQTQAAGPPGPPPRSIASPAAAGQPDDRHPIMVRLNSWTVGDMGHPEVDLQIIDAMRAQGGQVGRWLAEYGVDRERLHEEFGTPPSLDDMLERTGR